MSADRSETPARRVPLFSKPYGFAEAMTRFLADYDLGKAHDPSLRTEDIALDLLRTPEMQAIRRLLWVLNDDITAWRRDGCHYTDAYDEWHKVESELPHVAEWARSDP